MPTRATPLLTQCLDLDKEDENLVWDLQETGDPRDERLAGPPCYGQHRVDQHNCRIRNQHALILKCRVCQVRLLYVPVRGSAGDTRKPTPLRHMHGTGEGPPEGTGSTSTGTPPTPNEGPREAIAKAKAKAKAKSRIRHADGPNWEDFIIHTPEEETSYSMPESSPTSEGGEQEDGTGDGRPQWDGNPDTWEEYQAAVNDFFGVVRVPEEWDGDPNTWEEYQAAAQRWVDHHRGRASTSRQQGSQP